MSQPPSPGLATSLSRRQLLAWRNSMFVIFTVPGLAMASWVARLPAVRDTLGASTAEVGILLFGIAAGSIVGLLASSHIIARLGARTTMRIAVPIGTLGFVVAGVLATFAPNFGLLFAALALFGASFSIWDVAMNVSGAANERLLGRAIMPIFHAFFSFGTMVGAGLGSLAEATGVPIAVHLGLIGVVMLVVVFLAVRHSQSEHTLADGEQELADDDHSKSWRGRLGIWREPRTLFIGLIVLGMAFAEGSANDWLAIAMVDGHGVDNASGAFVFGIFVTSMTAGRLAGVKLLDRFGRVPVLRGSALLAAIGLLILIFGPNPWVAGVGVVLWGLGAALGFPVGMSAAADDPKTAAARVSAVATIGYCAFLVGPPLIGFLGDHFGILGGLLVVLLLVAIAGFASGAAREPAASGQPPEDELGGPRVDKLTTVASSPPRRAPTMLYDFSSVPGMARGGPREDCPHSSELWYNITYHSREDSMSAISATDARKNLFGLIQQVNQDHSPVEVVSKHGNAVIISKADYDALTETDYLLRSPRNAERLLNSIERARRGEVEHHHLVDVDEKDE